MENKIIAQFASSHKLSSITETGDGFLLKGDEGKEVFVDQDEVFHFEGKEYVKENLGELSKLLLEKTSLASALAKAKEKSKIKEVTENVKKVLELVKELELSPEEKKQLTSGLNSSEVPECPYTLGGKVRVLHGTHKGYVVTLKKWSRKRCVCTVVTPKNPSQELYLLHEDVGPVELNKKSV